MANGFRRTLVGLKQLVALAAGGVVIEFQKDPRWVEASAPPAAASSTPVSEGPSLG